MRLNGIVAHGWVDGSLYVDHAINAGGLSMTGAIPATRIDRDLSIGISLRPCPHCGLHGLEAIKTEEYSHEKRRIEKVIVLKCIDCGREVRE